MGCKDSRTCDNDEPAQSPSSPKPERNGKGTGQSERPRKSHNSPKTDTRVSGPRTSLSRFQPRPIQVKLNSGKCIQQLDQPLSTYYRILPGHSKGSAGRVHLAVHIVTGQQCVIKTIKKVASNNRGVTIQEKFSAEVNVLSRMDHPNIVKIYEVLEDEMNVYVVSEVLIGGELVDYCTSHDFTETMVSKIMYQVFSVLSYCHQQGITHRHLKLENLLLREVPTGENIFIKVTGFSGAAMLSCHTEMRRIVGCPHTIAPEVLSGRYDEKADIWSCGVMLYMLLSGESPFKGKTSDEILEKVKRGEFSFSSQRWEGISVDAKKLITSLLQKKPIDRPSASECLQNPWFLRVKDKSIGLSRPVRLSLLHLRSFQASQVLKQALYSFIVTRVLAKEETAALSQCFTDLDINADGKLSPEELVTALKKTMTADMAEEETQRVMGIVDMDGNGYIDYSEFMIASIKEENLLSDKNLKLAFKCLDRDNSKMVSVEELKAVLRISRGEDTEETWRKLMDELGIHSSEIDKYQFARFMRTAVTRHS